MKPWGGSARSWTSSWQTPALLRGEQWGGKAGQRLLPPLRKISCNAAGAARSHRRGAGAWGYTGSWGVLLRSPHPQSSSRCSPSPPRSYHRNPTAGSSRVRICPLLTSFYSRLCLLLLLLLLRAWAAALPGRAQDAGTSPCRGVGAPDAPTVRVPNGKSPANKNACDAVLSAVCRAGGAGGETQAFRGCPVPSSTSCSSQCSSPEEAFAGRSGNLAEAPLRFAEVGMTPKSLPASEKPPEVVFSCLQAKGSIFLASPLNLF